MRAGHRVLSVPTATVPDMAQQQQRRPRLRVVTGDPAPRDDEPTREAYWARLQSLRAERDRLRAG